MNFLIAALSLAVLLAVPAPAGANEASAALSAQLAVDNRLLSEALRSYADLRSRERSAQSELAVAESSLDRILEAPSSRTAEIDGAEQNRAIVRATLDIVSARVHNTRQNILDLRRRIAATRAEIGRGATASQSNPDRISGRWRVLVSSPPQTGEFVLRMDGAQISGSYTLQGARATEPTRTGSLSGTFAANRLRLQRIDSDSGFDGLFEGDVDPDLGTARGFYSPANLAAGGPAGSGWSAVRVPATGDGEASEEVP